MGEPVKVSVTFYNQSEMMKSVKAHLEISVAYYTGVISSEPLKNEDFYLDVEPFQSERHGVHVSGFILWIYPVTLGVFPLQVAPGCLSFQLKSMPLNWALTAAWRSP